MRLEQLQAFLAVADTGSFQAAARQCSVTQSTISRQVRSIEEDLGVPLFHRAGQVKLTLAGDSLKPRAIRICKEWTQAQQEIEDLVNGKQTELCVSGIHSVCAYLLPPIVTQFCQSHPNVQLRITALGSDRALKVLRDGLVDISIVMHNPLLTSNQEMVVTPLYEEPIELLMAAGHPLSEHDVVPWSEIARFPQVVFKDGYGMQRVVQSQFREYGQELKVALELNTLDAFRGVVRQGELIALLPQSALTESRHDPDLVVRPIGAPALSRKVVMVTTHDRLMIPPIQQFCELVSQQVAKRFRDIDKMATESGPHSASLDAEQPALTSVRMPEGNRFLSKLPS
ncbi:LysR substrate binding domain protein [Synechococcus sp. PCC 7335]|uniref:LysR family transcriptional regulator n=1 Tax=Synechococcus sp. (strain ATCC 29403 / PCC 7335) TaxID=91464 RepID=UPI00017EBC64|nr:LysR family transcriptional regulator [Synechococcus sp. PCC 7335]EDX87395.1 LysR substrate binding domain protein [Synechococcus sp. PCC 7335]